MTVKSVGITGEASCTGKMGNYLKVCLDLLKEMDSSDD
jgi:hypothetical protein